ncbi:hypothetical protein [Flavobacterium sp.]|uniref:hypothetical protein n=1 Tax=Flavobacterium sp. TaxID=239 RepID=UPI00263786F9|nr:hypothetical protein [Flavobacterium sp.]MDD2986835.1 hypothetical protein [Flavobacterium sp.]
MKTIKYTFFFTLATLLMAAECTKGDEEFYNSVYTTVPNLVNVETQNSYAVNDILWVNSNFSQFLAEPNQSTPLDIFKTTNSNKFSFLYSIEKQNSNAVWQNIANEDHFILDEGLVSINNYITAYAIYNASAQEYNYRGGIKLTEPGTYRIGFFAGYNGQNFDLISDSSTASTFLTIATSANNIDAGYYTFSVN